MRLKSLRVLLATAALGICAITTLAPTAARADFYEVICCSSGGCNGGYCADTWWERFSTINTGTCGTISPPPGSNATCRYQHLNME